MSRGIGERIDDLQLFGDRAGPSVRNNERQRTFVFRTNVNEMNVQPIDFGDELRQCVQFSLALSPIVISSPIAREGLSRLELDALRCICNRFSFGPLCRVDSPAQFAKLRVWKIHLLKWTNSICLLAASLCSTGLGHGILLFEKFWISLSCTPMGIGCDERPL